MGLSVKLLCPKCYECDHEEDGAREFYADNITHNVSPMATRLGVYDELWCPDEIDITVARQLIKPLGKAIKRMNGLEHELMELNPPNGWGSFEGFKRFITAYHRACCEHPEARVWVWA